MPPGREQLIRLKLGKLILHEAKQPGLEELILSKDSHMLSCFFNFNHLQVEQSPSELNG